MTQTDPAPRQPPEPVEATLRMRLGPTDVRYGTDLVAGATAMAIFGDLETEIALRVYGDEGLCVAYHSVEFLAPLRSGDFVEARAWIVARGRTSRRVQAEIRRVLVAGGDGTGEVLDPPMVAARAEATIVSGRRPQGG